MSETTKGTMQVDIKLVRQLAELLDETSLSEIEVEDGGRKIRVVRALTMAAPVAIAAPVAAAPVAAAPAPVAAPAGDHPGTVKSPMVGTFYRSPSPESKAFVDVGAKIEDNSLVCIIEAMKIMNEIQAETKGTIVEILVENGQPVEYGQRLFKLRQG